MRISATIVTGRDRANPKVSVELAVPLVASGIIEILTWWLLQTEDYPVETTSNLHDKLVVDPIMLRGYLSKL